MCLAVPAQLVTRDDFMGVADLHGNRVEISTALVPDAVVGDWVLVHAGFAIQKLDGDDLKETWAVLSDLAAAEGGAP
jgi:hydrogenase expression/formation protein HypC